MEDLSTELSPIVQQAVVEAVRQIMALVRGAEE
jgi:hypothetical protein